MQQYVLNIKERAMLCAALKQYRTAIGDEITEAARIRSFRRVRELVRDMEDADKLVELFRRVDPTVEVS